MSKIWLVRSQQAQMYSESSLTQRAKARSIFTPSCLPIFLVTRIYYMLCYRFLKLVIVFTFHLETISVTIIYILEGM